MNFTDPATNLASLPLSSFDEFTYEAILNSNLLLQLQENKEGLSLNARCLITHKHPSIVVYGAVTGYNPDRNLLEFTYTDDHKQIRMLVPRIYICFYTEDPSRFCERVEKAYKARIVAESHFRFC